MISLDIEDKRGSYSDWYQHNIYHYCKSKNIDMMQENSVSEKFKNLKQMNKLPKYEN